MELIKMVGEKPVLWNHTLNENEIDPAAKLNAWEEILISFPGIKIFIIPKIAFFILYYIIV